MSDRRNILSKGYRLHWYQIESMLGHGGFGLTYLALDTNLNQQVAIKEYLPSEMAARSDDHVSVVPLSEKHADMYAWGLDRFMAEARTLVQFNHRNIVGVISVFEANNTAYMVMEFEHGKDLDACFAEGRFRTEEELTSMAIPLLEGLTEVHAAGFIHRDIKPGNIYIREDNSPVLLDFGSARQSIDQKTQVLTSLYTPGFAPFEQYHESGGRQGAWTDLYALAATLYLAVTHKRPEDALRRSAAYVHGTEDPYIPVAEQAKGKYSKSFLNAIDLALNFREADRPQSALEWKQIIEGKKTRRARNNSTAQTKQPSASPTNKPLTIAASITVIGLGMAGYLWWQDQDLAIDPVQSIASNEAAKPPAKINPQQQRIKLLLELAVADERAGRLIAPINRNALARYQDVLQLDSDNTAAKTAVQQITARSIEKIKAALANEQYQRAEVRLNNATSAFGKTSDLKTLQEQLNQELEKIRLARQEATQEKQLADEAKPAEQKQRETNQLKQQQAQEQEKKRHIDQLLALASEDMAAGRLTGAPNKQDALSRYQEILAIDPGNASALKGITVITDKLTSQTTPTSDQSGPSAATNEPVQVTIVVYADRGGDVDEPSNKLVQLFKTISPQFAPKNQSVTINGSQISEIFYFKPKQHDTAKRICNKTKSSVLVGGNFENAPGSGRTESLFLVAFNCTTEEFLREEFLVYYDDTTEDWYEDWDDAIKTFLRSKKPFSSI